MSEPLIEFEVPAGDEPSKCRSCGALIVWTETRRGKRMPLSLATVRTEEETGRRYAQSHFADCPFSAEHRRRRHEEEDRPPIDSDDK